MKELEREIEVVENLLSLLNRCLALYIKDKKYEFAKNTRIDIETVKAELNRLITEREAELVKAVKEPLGDAICNRSGKNIS
jgi:hypothetical protein